MPYNRRPKRNYELLRQNAFNVEDIDDVKSIDSVGDATLRAPNKAQRAKNEVDYPRWPADAPPGVIDDGDDDDSDASMGGGDNGGGNNGGGGTGGNPVTPNNYPPLGPFRTTFDTHVPNPNWDGTTISTAYTQKPCSQLANFVKAYRISKGWAPDDDSHDSENFAGYMQTAEIPYPINGYDWQVDILDYWKHLWVPNEDSREGIDYSLDQREIYWETRYISSNLNLCGEPKRITTGHNIIILQGKEIITETFNIDVATTSYPAWTDFIEDFPAFVEFIGLHKDHWWLDWDLNELRWTDYPWPVPVTPVREPGDRLGFHREIDAYFLGIPENYRETSTSGQTISFEDFEQGTYYAPFYKSQTDPLYTIDVKLLPNLDYTSVTVRYNGSEVGFGQMGASGGVPDVTLTIDLLANFALLPEGYSEVEIITDARIFTVTTVFSETAVFDEQPYTEADITLAAGTPPLKGIDFVPENSDIILLSRSGQFGFKDQTARIALKPPRAIANCPNFNRLRIYTYGVIAFVNQTTQAVEVMATTTTGANLAIYNLQPDKYEHNGDYALYIRAGTPFYIWFVHKYAGDIST